MKKASAKEEVRKMLESLPDDSTLEDIQYSLYVRQLVTGRARQADSAKLIPQAEVERRMSRWLGK